LQDGARAIPGRVSWHWIETGDHSFRPLKKQTGLSTDDVLGIAAPEVVTWVQSI